VCNKRQCSVFSDLYLFFWQTGTFYGHTTSTAQRPTVRKIWYLKICTAGAIGPKSKRGLTAMALNLIMLIQQLIIAINFLSIMKQEDLCHITRLNKAIPRVFNAAYCELVPSTGKL